jgi:hypothetical protein
VNRVKAVLAHVICVLPAVCHAQQTLPDAPSPTRSAVASPSYSPPTQGGRFKAYIKRTYGIEPLVEGAIRGGVEQARDEPSQWPKNGQGYADRFGSAMGQIAIRGTTEYVVADLLKEDLRFIPCGQSCSPSSRFKAALQDTFLARKGEDGHRAFSVARLVGPFSGSAVAVETWYPAGYGGSEIFKQGAFSYFFMFARSYVKELTAH